MRPLPYFKAAFLLICSVFIAACSPPQEPPQTPQAKKSKAAVCSFAEQLETYARTADDTKSLRFLNEQWRSLAKSNAFLSEQAAQQSRRQLTALNYQLADETLNLLEQATAIAQVSYEKIELLRRYSEAGVEVPKSLTRELNSKLQDCCMAKLDGNSTALVREEKDSALYEVGTLGYFVQRDLSQLMNNELTFAAYQQQREAAASRLRQVQRPQFDTELEWAACKPLK